MPRSTVNPRAAAMLLLLAVSAGIPAVSPLMPVCVSHSAAGMNPSTARSVDYIAISGNEDLLTQASSNGWTGSGTQNDPVIISGYTMRSSHHLLRVTDTDLHFVFRDSYLDGVDGYWCGLYFHNVTHGEVRNVVVTNAAIGFHMSKIHRCTIANCSVYNNYNQGIVLEYACLFNRIENNTVRSNALDGILLDFGNKHNSVSGNLVQENRQSGIYLYENSSFNLVVNNSILRNRVWGIHAGGDSSMFSGNRVSEHLGSGVYISGRENSVILNCLWSNDAYGVRLSGGAQNNAVLNNTVLDSRLRGAALGAGTANNTLKFNDFIGNGGPSQGLDDGTGNAVSCNYWNPSNCIDRDHDGIADDTYALDGEAANRDESPSIRPCNDIPLWYEFVPNPTGYDGTGVPDASVVSVILLVGSATAVVVACGVVLGRGSRGSGKTLTIAVVILFCRESTT